VEVGGVKSGRKKHYSTEDEVVDISFKPCINTKGTLRMAIGIHRADILTAVLSHLLCPACLLVYTEFCSVILISGKGPIQMMVLLSLRPSSPDFFPEQKNDNTFTYLLHGTGYSLQS